MMYYLRYVRRLRAQAYGLLSASIVCTLLLLIPCSLLTDVTYAQGAASLSTQHIHGTDVSNKAGWNCNNNVSGQNCTNNQGNALPLLPRTGCDTSANAAPDPGSSCDTSKSTAQTSRDTHAETRLLIPAIGVDAPVESVGVLSNRSLNVPQKNRWAGVGWYKDGPQPGQRGSAVIAGHLDRPGGVPAVFWRLQQLQKGDKVTVVSKGRQAQHFYVVRLQRYQPDKAPLDKIYGDTSGTYLNLITCAGPWIPSQHQTAERLVVYTKSFN